MANSNNEMRMIGVNQPYQNEATNNGNLSMQPYFGSNNSGSILAHNSSLLQPDPQSSWTVQPYSTVQVETFPQIGVIDEGISKVDQENISFLYSTLKAPYDVMSRFNPAGSFWPQQSSLEQPLVQVPTVGVIDPLSMNSMMPQTSIPSGPQQSSYQQPLNQVPANGAISPLGVNSTMPRTPISSRPTLQYPSGHCLFPSSSVNNQTQLAPYDVMPEFNPAGSLWPQGSSHQPPLVQVPTVGVIDPLSMNSMMPQTSIPSGPQQSLYEQPLYQVPTNCAISPLSVNSMMTQTSIPSRPTLQYPSGLCPFPSSSVNHQTELVETFSHSGVGQSVQFGHDEGATIPQALQNQTTSFGDARAHIGVLDERTFQVSQEQLDLLYATQQAPYGVMSGLRCQQSSYQQSLNQFPANGSLTGKSMVSQTSTPFGRTPQHPLGPVLVPSSSVGLHTQQKWQKIPNGIYGPRFTRIGIVVDPILYAFVTGRNFDEYHHPRR